MLIKDQVLLRRQLGTSPRNMSHFIHRKSNQLSTLDILHPLKWFKRYVHVHLSSRSYFYQGFKLPFCGKFSIMERSVNLKIGQLGR